MIHLQDITDSVTLRIAIDGYQFPQGTCDWLMVRVQLNFGTSQFERTDPALEVGELARLEEWLADLQRGAIPRFTSLSFTEPCLELQLVGRPRGPVRFSVALDHELKPDFVVDPFGVGLEPGDECTCSFECSEAQLQEIIDNVREERRRWPRRVVRRP